jgi:hypothetical protein
MSYTLDMDKTFRLRIQFATGAVRLETFTTALSRALLIIALAEQPVTLTLEDVIS